MNDINVVIATYGDDCWNRLANERAWPSALSEAPGHTTLWHFPDGTRASSLNDAAAKDDTDWLLFLDADDELAPGYVGAMRRALEQNPHDGQVLLTPAVQHIRAGRPGAPSFMELPDRKFTLREYNWLVIGTLIHRDLFNEVGGFPDYPHGFEDFALWSKCYRAGATVVKVPDAVYRYHHNPQSAHRKAWRDRKAQTAMHRLVISELDAWEHARPH